MKILSIGNSFSQDSHKWLHKLAEKNNYDLQTVNLYIGACNLKRHWNEYLNNTAEYDLELNGGEGIRKISLTEALEMDEFDVITLQQVSHHSGNPQTYYPYIVNLADLVRSKQPNTKLYFVQTWAYETDSTHPGFARYNNDQHEMFRRISDCSKLASNLINVDIIPIGEVIQSLRETIPEFDYGNGGMSLCRDTFHLSMNYGRYAAAVTMYMVITGNKVNVTEFEDFDVDLMNKIVAIVEKVFEA